MSDSHSSYDELRGVNPNPLLNYPPLEGIEPQIIKMIQSAIITNLNKTEWSYIVGLDYAKSKIKQIAILPLKRPDLFTGIRSPPKGILLFGPPGTGKTMIGRCIASQANATFFSITSSTLASEWSGDEEKAMKTLFEVARCMKPSVVFIDEVDSLLKSSRRMKTEFLSQLDGLSSDSNDGLLVIGTTNRPQDLDEAVRRRFAARLHVPLPEAASRRRMIVNNLHGEKHSLTDQQVASIAEKTKGYSGSDMKHLCHEAAMCSLKEMTDELIDIEKDAIREIRYDDFCLALNTVKPSFSSDDLSRFEEWNRKYGSDHSDNQDSSYGELGSENSNPLLDYPRLEGIEPRIIKMIQSAIITNLNKTEWSHIVGLDYAKSKIEQIAILPLKRPDLFTGIRSQPKGILLFGPPGTGKTMIGRCIATQANATFFSITSSTLASKWAGDDEKAMKTLFEVARCMKPSVVFIDEVDSLLNSRRDDEPEWTRRMKTEFLSQFDGLSSDCNDGLLVIGTTNRPQDLDEAVRRRFAARLHIPLPEAAARRRMIVGNLRDEKHSLTDEQVASIAEKTEGYSGSDMKDLCREAAMCPFNEVIYEQIDIEKDAIREIRYDDFCFALNTVKPSLSFNDLARFEKWNRKYGYNHSDNQDCVNGGDSSVGGLKSEKPTPLLDDPRLKGIEPQMIEKIQCAIITNLNETYWSHIAGLDYAKSKIKQIAILPLKRPDLFTGIRSPPKGILMFGPPGTGKTMIGRCIATQANATFFSITSSTVASKWIGDAEKAMKTLFEVARCMKPSVVFIDEVDSLLKSRCDFEHESFRRMKTEFLSQMDGLSSDSNDGLLVIGTTNRPQDLDEAVRRRFAARLHIPLPGAAARRHMIVGNLRDEKHSLTDEQVASIAEKTEGYSGSDIKDLCREAAMCPFNEVMDEQIDIEKDAIREIRYDDFCFALNTVKPSLSSSDLTQFEKFNRKYGSNH